VRGSWTLVDAAILRPFEVAHSDRLVVIWAADPASRNRRRLPDGRSSSTASITRSSAS
jgi:hypothetical protein